MTTSTAQDLIITCRECKESFLFAVKEQERFAKSGYKHTPTTCMACKWKPLIGKTVQGTVVRFDAQLGYGFAQRELKEAHEPNYFVHFSQILTPERGGNGHQPKFRSLIPGQRIEFEIAVGKNRRLAAVNVSVI